MMLDERFAEHWEKEYRVREYGKYVVAHQGICHGQLTFKGTRVLVAMALESLARPGRTIEQVAMDYRVPVEAITEALQLAVGFMREQMRLPDPHPDKAPTAKKTKRETPAVLDRAA